MTNRDVIKYNLDYTMDWLIRKFELVPDDRIWVRPRPNINAPGWIFAHVAVTEREHVGAYLQGIDDVPPDWRRIFRIHRPPTDEELQAVAAPRPVFISYWQEVRQKTHEYLDSITDEDLLKVPEKSLHPPGHPNSDNPALEWLTMTIQHQNEHRGQLDIILKLLGGD